MPAVIPFAALAAALIAWLILYATGTMARMIASFIPNWHIIGLGHLRDFVVGAVNKALGWVGDFMDDTIRPLANFLIGIVTVPALLFSMVERSISTAYTVSRWIVVGLVPREIGKLQRWTAGRVAGAIAIARAITAALAHVVAVNLIHAYDYTKARITGLAATVARDFAAAKAYTAGRIAAVERDLSHAISRAEAVARAVVAGATAKLAHDIGVVDAKIATTTVNLTKTIAADVVGLEAKIGVAASAATAAALGTLAVDIEHAAGAEWGALTDAVKAAEGVAAGEFADITDWLKSIPDIRVGDIAGVTTIAITGIGALTRYLEKCGMPNCRNTSAFGRGLRDLQALVGGAELLAWLIRIAADPQGGAKDVVDTVTPFVDAVDSGVKHLFSIGG